MTHAHAKQDLSILNALLIAHRKALSLVFHTLQTPSSLPACFPRFKDRAQP